MKTLVVAALAATVALASAAAPAFAEEGHRTVKKVIIHTDHGRHHGWHEGRHEGWRHHHEGWRHSNVSKKVIIKHGDRKTVIKKHEG